MKVPFLIIAVPLAVGLGLAVHPLPAAAGGSDSAAAEAAGRASAVATCDNLNKRKLRTDTPATEASTTSTTYVPIAHAAQPITVSALSCVVVTYSARAYAEDGPSSEAMFVRARLDNAITARPSDGGDIAFTASDVPGFYDAHSFTWVFPSVAPGHHTVSMEFRSATGDPVFIYQHTLDVEYR